MSEVAINIELSRGVEEVWRAIFDHRVRRVWWSRSVALNDEPGSSFVELWRDGEGHEIHSRGEVLEIQPQRLLRLSWRDDDWPVETEVTLRLEPLESGCRLELTHNGFSDLGPKLLFNLEEYQTGWADLLEELRSYLAGRAEELGESDEEDDENGDEGLDEQPTGDEDVATEREEDQKARE